MTDKKNLTLVDGYGFVFRAYHSMPPLTRPDGTPVGAVYGFTNMLIKLLADHKADYLAVILDAGEKTFRNDIYKEYKANRPPAPEDLIPQFPLVREASKALNLPTIDIKGYEADDLIATYAKQAKESGYKVTIISSDKDLMQLVDEDVVMYDPVKSKTIGINEVKEKYGVLPDKMLDLLSLMGDSSDNVPGVAGIGPKTAAELIEAYGDLDGVLENAEQIKQPKRRQTLIESKELARLSRDLIKLDCNAPVPLEISQLLLQEIDNEKLVEFLQEQGFKRLIERFKREVDSSEKEFKVNFKSQKLNDSPQIKQIISRQKEIKNVYLNIDYNKQNEACSVCFAFNDKEIFYFPLDGAAKAKQASLFDDEHAGGVDLKSVLLEFKSLFLDKSIKFILNDAKKTLIRLLEYGISMPVVDDIAVMSYSARAGFMNHELIAMNDFYLDGLLELSEDKKIYEFNDKQKQDSYCLRLFTIAKLYKVLQNVLFESKKINVYQAIERPLIYVLAKMEHNGIKVDRNILAKMSEDFAGKMAGLEKEIYQIAGTEFNIASPKQLGEVLFDNMGIQGGKKSKKTGAYSTNAEVLEELSIQGHDIASHILSWRQLAKLKSTYTDSLPKQIKQDGRVHTTFVMTSTTTGRLSSVEPNLQNIPIRSEEGNKIRTAFVAESGKKLISADYSQIELRLLAHVAGIDVLKRAFKDGRDIHAITASHVLGMELDKVSAEDRRKAKMINFGIIYGISAFGLAHRLGISRGEAGQYIDEYFKKYPGIKEYMEKTKEEAREKGFVETIYGRRIYVKGINDKNPALRQFAERAAINAPLQGAAADIIKKAMNNIDKQLGVNAKMLLQVHDELIFETAEDNAEAVAKMVKTKMEQVSNISVPTIVEVGVGNSWAEIH